MDIVVFEVKYAKFLHGQMRAGVKYLKFLLNVHCILYVRIALQILQNALFQYADTLIICIPFQTILAWSDLI